MRNEYLNEKGAADIDRVISKIILDLDNPNPPIRLEVVRALLKLDKGYYSAQNTGHMQELLHRLTMAGKQIVLRPTLLAEAILKFDLKALYLPDSKRILLSSDLPTAKQRWSEAHEAVHSIIPWHEGLMLGDTLQTLSPACHESLEAEANYGAGRLLFMQERFSDELKSGPIALESVIALSKSYGNTITSTLWRSVEQLDIPAIGLVCEHPHYLSTSFNPADPIRYFIRSRAFERQFSNVTEGMLFGLLGKYCTRATKGPIGEVDACVWDANGDQHMFHFESFHNTYDNLTLATYIGAKQTVVGMPG